MIPDPDDMQLTQLHTYYLWASVPSYQYRTYRSDCTWVYICGSYTAKEIFEKIAQIGTDDRSRVMFIGLLVALSFRKLTEAKPFLDQIDAHSDYWVEEIKNRVIKDATSNEY